MGVLGQSLHILPALSVMVRVYPWPREAALRHVEALTAAWQELMELGGAVEFRLKPKFHLFRHLVAEVAPLHGLPTLYWCCQDEDCGCRDMKALARKGGRNAAAPIAERGLHRLLAQL